MESSLFKTSTETWGRAQRGKLVCKHEDLSFIPNTDIRARYEIMHL